MLFPHSINELLRDKNEAHFFVQAIEHMSLSDLEETFVVNMGGKSYPRRVLLTLWRLGYATSVNSSSKLETAARTNLAVVFIAGGRASDHATLSSLFRQGATRRFSRFDASDS